ncbi:hypothetical protein CFP65_2727 [Kitasatospora sp. MMS16-BH015]|uniref:hypothetical protein n=1 Tax=Kitasatospora sp. MMS16-BH015 TaxID=2018025 RepID=UPI000CA39DAF|nr:hypothetical protein [Kitasatospora sp. MMS16-BH015]AUG77546.1 hypothetical protein CFP65_2727 [Kitasatospora sp. MMS16-BH015]
MDELTLLMDELVSGEAPATAVDAGAAIRAGRGRIRRRRFAMGAAALAVVTVACGVLAQTTPGRTPVLPTAPATASPAPRTGTDPLVAPARFGWLPSWAVKATFTAIGVGTGVRAEDGSPGPGGRAVILKRYSSEQMPPEAITGSWQHLDRINGGEAYLSSPSTNGGPKRTLMWRTVHGDWATLLAENLSAAELADLPQIAADVVFGDAPVPLPLTLPKLPADFRVLTVTLDLAVNSATRIDAATGRRTSPWAFSAHWTGASGEVAVTVDPASRAEILPARPGRACRLDAGMSICAYWSGSEDPLAPVGGAAAWLKQVTLLGDDQRNWTTQAFG